MMKWIYLAITLWVIMYVSNFIEQYAGKDDIQIIRGGAQP